MSKAPKGESEKIEFTVTILRREEIVTHPRIGETLVIMLISYVGNNLGMRTIKIPKDEWSIEVEKAAIKKHIESRLAFKPETYKV